MELAFYPSFLKGDIFYHIFAVNDFGYNLALIYFIHVSVTTGALLWVKVRKCKKQLFFPFHLNSRSFLTVLVTTCPVLRFPEVVRLPLHVSRESQLIFSLPSLFSYFYP